MGLAVLRGLQEWEQGRVVLGVWMGKKGSKVQQWTGRKLPHKAAGEYTQQFVCTQGEGETVRASNAKHVCS